MKKKIISILGQDRPGIIAAVTRILFEQDCNIENVSQTILQNEFSGIFIIGVPQTLADKDLHRRLNDGLAPMGLHVYEKPLSQSEAPEIAVESEPFVITTRGPDRLGLVSGITEVIAGFGVNITNLRAAFRGGDDPSQNTMIYEVDVPVDINRQSFRQALGERAKDLDLELSLQHREIFEALHRI